MTRRLLAYSLSLLTLTAAAHAQAPAAALSLDPYLDNQSFLAVHADLTKIDIVAIGKFITDALPDGNGDKEFPTKLTMARLAADAFLENLKHLGAHDAYLIMSHPDVWPAMNPLAILLPVENGRDAKPLLNFLTPYFPATAILPNNVVFAGQEIPLRRLQSLKPQARPDLQFLAATTTSPIQAVLAATADTRRVVTDMMPRLPSIPEVPGIGGQSTDFFTKDFINITLALDLPPSPSLTLNANSTTHAGATQSSQLLQTALQALANDHGHQDELRTSPVGPQMQSLAGDITRQLAAAPASPNTISLHFNSDQLRSVIQILASAAGKAQDHTLRVQSADNLRHIAIASLQYSNDHKNEWPASLDALTPYILGGQLPTNPDDPQHRRYILHPWTSEQIATLQRNNAPNTPIAYEDTDDDNAPIAIAYLDGHVELRKNKKDLTDAIAAAETSLKK